jgi:hypothetical protein
MEHCRPGTRPQLPQASPVPFLVRIIRRWRFPDEGGDRVAFAVLSENDRTTLVPCNDIIVLPLIAGQTIRHVCGTNIQAVHDRPPSGFSYPPMCGIAYGGT